MRSRVGRPREVTLCGIGKEAGAAVSLRSRDANLDRLASSPGIRRARRCPIVGGSCASLLSSRHDGRTIPKRRDSCSHSEPFAVSLTDIGILVGLYSVPGIVLALPGGAIGQRFGDKTTVVAGLVLMIAGSCMMVFSSDWIGQIAGRLVSGIGGVLMSVLMTKMVADWFVGKELSTAMAILVNSWPIGIAVSLLVLPPSASPTSTL